MAFRFKTLQIPGLLLIEFDTFKDHRGVFFEMFKLSEFRKNGINFEFVQVNFSSSGKGVLRGLHYQLRPAEQGKLVRCVKGKILDVAVDIRKGSPWYAKYVSLELCGDIPQLFWIPPGFAHGFLALEPSEVMYIITKEYSPQHERGIVWNDKTIDINWGIERLGLNSPILSEKDSKLPPLELAENNFWYEK